MSALLPLSQYSFSTQDGLHYVVTKVQYLAANDTVKLDPQVKSATVFHLEGGTAPDAVVSAPSAGTRTITLGGNTAGTPGKIVVVGLAFSQGGTLGSGLGV